MPKLKTHRGAAKRFRRAANGRIKSCSSFRQHGLRKRNTKLKRKMRLGTNIHAADKRAVDRLLDGS